MHLFRFIFVNVVFIFIVHGAVPRLRGSPHARIVGGAEAAAKQFLYSAAVYKTTATGIFFCGGALVDVAWVLTAGHCVQDGTSWTIKLGSPLLDVDDPNRLTLITDFAVIHNLFNPETMENDIGLIKFRTRIDFTDFIQPIAFKSNDYDDGKNAIVIGWGQIDGQTTDLSQNLRFVELSAISNAECSLTFGDFIKDGMLCAVGPDNAGFCNGDSGSPLVQTLDSGAVIVGVASFLSSNGCDSADPSGFTRSAVYQDWIAAIIQNV